MTAAGIYTRISKDDTGTALGVARQERLCRDLAEAKGLNVAQVFTDNDISAYKGQRRPGLEALIAAAEHGRIGAVVVYHVDRLYRRVIELEALVSLVERTRLAIYTVAAGDLDLSTASGQMIARILSSVAQGEVGRMSERLRAKSDELARTGRPPGGRPPYGYRAGYEVDEVEARWLRHAADRVLGGWSLVRTAAELDELGAPTREGRDWHSSTLRNALVRPAIAGLRVHRREIAGPGDWEPIVDRDTWERLRVVLADPKRRHLRSGGPYLLTGLVRSPDGEHVNGRVSAKAARSYGNASIQIHAERLETKIVDAILERFDHAEPPTPETGPGESLDGIEAELAQLAELRGRGVITLAEWLAARAPLQRRLDDARAAVTPVDNLPPLGPSLRATWPTLPFGQKQAVIRSVIARIVVRPVGRQPWVPIEERVTVEWKV